MPLFLLNMIDFVLHQNYEEGTLQSEESLGFIVRNIFFSQGERPWVYNFYQKMNKNIHHSPKSWKSNNEGHKTTNSLIFTDLHKLNNDNVCAFVQKNGKESPQSKVVTIQRHCSEEDFKKYFNCSQSPLIEPPSKVQDEYFPENLSLTHSKHLKSQFYEEKSTKIQGRGVNREKSELHQYYKKPNILKETSSTQSQQNLKVCSRPIPNFMRNRPKNYNFLRLSSPRIHLRRENFKIYSKLGEGKFGRVFLVKEIKTNFILAMKIIEKAKIVRENLLEQFIRELKIQTFLNHPNIISLYGFFQDETHFYTLMELGCDRQLYSLIEHHKILSEETTSFIVKNLLEAITYIHDNRVLHRDIKPENIVLIMGNVKVCDFGWAVNKVHSNELRVTFCGTPLYLSPEILQGNRYDEKVDLWAIGILAYELIYGCSPFDIMDQCDLQKIVTQDVRFPEEKETTEEFQEFIKAMLTKNPKERLSSRQLLQLDFIQKYQAFETCQELCR